MSEDKPPESIVRELAALQNIVNAHAAERREFVEYFWGGKPPPLVGSASVGVVDRSVA